MAQYFNLITRVDRELGRIRLPGPCGMSQTHLLCSRLVPVVIHFAQRVAPCAYRKSNPGILEVQSAQNGRQRMRPTVSATRDIGASLCNDKWVRVPL
jgi:hypothetical protein